MAKKQTFMEDVDSIVSFKNKLLDPFVCEQLNKSIFSDGNLEVAFNSLNNLIGEEVKEKHFIDFLHYVDRTFVNYSGSDKDAKRKLCAILSNCIYFDKIYDKIKNYSFRELLLLCSYASYCSCEDFEYIESILDQNILGCVINKDKSFYVQDDLLNNVFIEIEENKKSKEEVIEHINNSTLRELYDEQDYYMNLACERGDFKI